jgi:hypothetical protein
MTLRFRSTVYWRLEAIISTAAKHIPIREQTESLRRRERRMRANSAREQLQQFIRSAHLRGTLSKRLLRYSIAVTCPLGTASP